MAFRNPIVSGIELVRSAIESGNFVEGSAGWAIFQNGNAEFNSITIRGADVVDSVQLFYNGPPALGNLLASISPSSGTDPYGNTYQMGIVAYDTGGDYIQQANGVNVGWNLSLSGLSSSGQIGLFDMGSGTTQQGVVEIQPPTSAGNGPPILDLVSESSDATQTGYIYLGNTDEIRSSPQSTSIVKLTITQDGTHIYECAALTSNGMTMIGSANAMLPGSTTIAPETWHTVTPSALWTTTGASNPARYRVEPQGTALTVRLDGELLTTGAGPWPANATMFSLPVGYHPSAGHPFVTRSDIAVTAGQDTVNVLTSGGVQNGQTFTAAGQRLFFDGVTYPLD